MHPILVHIPTPFGEVPVYSYSVMVLVAYFAATAYAYFEARRLGEDGEKVLDLSFWVFLASILGSRLLEVLVNWRRFAPSPLDIFKIWQGGLTYYGGFIAAILTCLGFIRFHRLALGKWADLLAPVAMIALGFGRIGCFLNGCCYGRPAAGLPWAVTFPPGILPVPLDSLPLHPTQLYESLIAFLIAGISYALERRPHRPGVVVWTMILLYALARFFLEFLRLDPRGGIASLGLSTSQAVALPLALLSLGALAWTFRPHGPKLASSTPA